MATLASDLVRVYDAALRAPLAPVATDPSPASLATSQRFSIGTAGQPFVVSATDSFPAVAGDSSVTCTTSRPLFPAGVYRFCLPDGCTHVALIQASGATASGQAYAG
jgi:hypothetical protein